MSRKLITRLAPLGGGFALTAMCVATLTACGSLTSSAETAPSTTAAPLSPHAELGLVRRSRGWADDATATLHPGVQTYTGDGQCTANFVFTDAAGNAYLGQAAHCAGTGQSEDTNGCSAQSLPVGTPVVFRQGGSPISSGTEIGTGTLAYSSWVTMHVRHERDTATCAYNDFALIRLPGSERSEVSPTIPFWGGPDGIVVNGGSAGESVHSYGNSSLRGGFSQLSPQTGQLTDDDAAAGGWSHALQSATPGIPGDSGSAYLDAEGRALGTLSTLGLSVPITNNIGDLRKELLYAQKYSGIRGLALELGTSKFHQ